MSAPLVGERPTPETNHGASYESGEAFGPPLPIPAEAARRSGMMPVPARGSSKVLCATGLPPVALGLLGAVGCRKITGAAGEAGVAFEPHGGLRDSRKTPRLPISLKPCKGRRCSTGRRFARLMKPSAERVLWDFRLKIYRFIPFLCSQLLSPCPMSRSLI
jgi:hypothetical protein